VITIERLKAPTAYNYQNFKTSKGAYNSERVKLTAPGIPPLSGKRKSR